METNKEREIIVYLNSPMTITTSAQYWGELKKQLVNEFDYPSEITGIDPNTNRIYDSADSKLPEGNAYINIIVTKTKYGKL